MIVTFCGHAQYIATKEDKQRLLTKLEEVIGDAPAEFYVGGYGAFDAFAYTCAKSYQKNHPETKLVYVTPYMTIEYQKNHLERQKDHYDSIYYPELENVPLKFAILERNKHMVEKADYVIAYVDHTWGGAYKFARMAKNRGLQVINLGSVVIEGNPRRRKKE